MSIELKIRDLLNQEKDILNVVDQLLNLSASSEAKTADICTITQFLVIAGFYREAFLQFPRRFYEKKSIAWSHFVEILNKCNIEPTKAVVNALFEGAQELNKDSQLVFNKSWDHLDPRFDEKRQILLHRKIDELEVKRASLLQKIEFLRNHRMIRDEQKSYRKYLEMFPDDLKIKKQFQEFQERWAREVIDKTVEARRINEKKSDVSPALSKNEVKLCRIILKSCEDYIRRDSRLAYDFAIMFFNFDFLEISLKLLESCKETQSCIWFKLELLMESEEYIQVLEECSQIEKNQIDDPEIKFALAYLKAKAFSKLGQRELARQLFQEIVNLRPTYRSAATLLREVIEGREI